MARRDWRAALLRVLARPLAAGARWLEGRAQRLPDREVDDASTATEETPPEEAEASEAQGPPEGWLGHGAQGPPGHWIEMVRRTAPEYADREPPTWSVPESVARDEAAPPVVGEAGDAGAPDGSAAEGEGAFDEAAQADLEAEPVEERASEGEGETPAVWAPRRGRPVRDALQRLLVRVRPAGPRRAWTGERQRAQERGAGQWSPPQVTVQAPEAREPLPERQPPRRLKVVQAPEAQEPLPERQPPRRPVAVQALAAQPALPERQPPRRPKVAQAPEPPSLPERRPTPRSRAAQASERRPSSHPRSRPTPERQAPEKAAPAPREGARPASEPRIPAAPSQWPASQESARGAERPPAPGPHWDRRSIPLESEEEPGTAPLPTAPPVEVRLTSTPASAFWPSLPEDEPAEDDAEERWEARQRAAERRRRLDREQRGLLWNE